MFCKEPIITLDCRGLLGWKLFHMGGGGGCCVGSGYDVGSPIFPVTPPGPIYGQTHVPGPVTWAFEPAALGLANCGSRSHDKLNVFGLDRLVTTSSHQQ